MDSLAQNTHIGSNSKRTPRATASSHTHHHTCIYSAQLHHFRFVFSQFSISISSSLSLAVGFYLSVPLKLVQSQCAHTRAHTHTHTHTHEGHYSWKSVHSAEDSSLFVGANIQLEDNSGMNALTQAIKSGHRQIRGAIRFVEYHNKDGRLTTKLVCFSLAVAQWSHLHFLSVATSISLSQYCFFSGFHTHFIYFVQQKGSSLRKFAVFSLPCLMLFSILYTLVCLPWWSTIVVIAVFGLIHAKTGLLLIAYIFCFPFFSRFSFSHSCTY